MDAELEFAIQPNTVGKQLFDQVSGTVCTKADVLLTSEYFNMTEERSLFSADIITLVPAV